MKIKEIAKNTLAFNNEIIENYFNKIAALQNDIEGVAEKALESAEIIPEEGRKSLSQIISFGREYREEVRTQVEKGRETLNQLFV